MTAHMYMMRYYKKVCRTQLSILFVIHTQTKIFILVTHSLEAKCPFQTLIALFC